MQFSFQVLIGIVNEKYFFKGDKNRYEKKALIASCRQCDLCYIEKQS